MNKLWAMLACGLLAVPAVAANPGTLTVEDRAKAFTADGLAKAKGLMESAEFLAPTHLTVVTGGDADVPAAYKADFDAARKNKDNKAGLRVLGNWAADEALKHADKGVFVLVWTEGNGVLTYVKADKTTDSARHFDAAADRELADLLAKEFKAGRKDQGLYEATAFVVDKLKNTTVPARTAQAAGGRAAPAKQGGFSVGSLICFGLVAALGIWLVFGLIRAFTQPRGGYGPGGGGGYGGGGYGGGGGGGGFMSGMMGGLFGAVAGNYLYNSFTGGGSSLGASGMDGGGATGAGGYPDATGGDGDYAGGSEGGAGGFDDAGGDAGGAGGFDDAGGGDFGGGGGDFGGGGGDFGGGGGDSGGGGGDW